MNLKEKISIIIPTYNERENIINLIEAIHSRLHNFEHEIIVIDDSSPDGTYKCIDDTRLPYVKALLRTGKPSLAGSIRLGLDNSSGSILVIMDSDFNHQPKYIPFMVENLQYYDCISASRFLYGGYMESRSRQILSWLFNVFLRLITGGHITDNLYGFFSIRKQTLEKYNYDNIFRGYGDYYMRLLYYLQKDRLKILEFPAINGARPAGKSNQRFIKTFLQYCSAAIKLAYKPNQK